MKKLIRGIVRFHNTVRPGYRETFARLALGQKPDALFICCSDSRVAPNLFASTDPGDLFVVRNVGNMIPPALADGRSSADESEAAAIEFALLQLNVKDVIVCGHSECGAMQALLEGPAPAGAPNLAAWLRHGGESLRRLGAGPAPDPGMPRHNQLSQLNVLTQLEHLRSYGHVREREQAGTIRVHGWWFDIAQAEVRAYEPALGQFIPIDEAEAARLLERMET